MNKINTLSRRGFLKSTGAVTGASLFRIGAPSLAAIAQAACTARDTAAPFATLGSDEARDIAAITARLIPTTDTPGAAEAGVVYFFDNVLGNYQAGFLGPVRSFRDDLNAGLDKAFADLTETEQDAALHRIENDPRFEAVRVLTIFGFFAMEKHGGNKGHVSWDLIGFKGHHGAWAPPFGYYDAEYAREQSDGE
ncbi:MAG: gluconate 2-dehydrogenase subunit 3 family protein [Gammaproteobacteria bacterium]|nr:gluconate 2-dehydrogenase subunit 3 family protein [Gammaproteobacteria bacterium]MDH5617935.1 gluconate 2-dehydrogenase subunit 3 family protein [Gammaproteobacteria bacterium]